MFVQPKRKPKVMYTDNSIEFGNSVKTFLGIMVREHRTDRKLIGLLREQCAEWKKVCGFHGMFLQSAKHSWSLVWWEDTLWEAFRSWKARLFRSEREEKHKWAIGKPKLENARRFWGIYFVDPDDREFKETIKNARKKLEVLRPIFLFAGQVGSLLLDSTVGGAWLFFFGEMICFVNYFNDRDLCLLNSVQHDSYLTTSYKDCVYNSKYFKTKRVCEAPLCSVFCHSGFLYWFCVVPFASVVNATSL